MDLSTISNLVIKLMEELIEDDESRHILETDLTPMECLLRYITTHFKDRLPEAARETMKIWLQLLHNCLTHAKSLLHRSQQQRQRYLDCLMYCNPGKLSKEVKEWKLLFDSIFQGFHRDFSVFASAAEVVIAPVIDLVIPLMKDVIEGEQIRHILETELSPMDILLLDISTVFPDQQKAGPENLKIWLQLLHHSLTRATSILHTSELRQRQRQRSVDCVIRNPGRLSKQIEQWKVLFNYIFEGLQKDFLVFLSSPEVVISPFIAPVIPVMEDVIQEEENRHILQTELRPMLNLLLDISAVFSQDQQTAGPRILKLRLQLLHDYLAEAKTILHLMSSPGRVSKDINEWKALFDCLFQDLQRDFSIFVTAAHQIIHRDPIPAFSAKGSEQLYQSYDALPTSDLKNCLLYSAIYHKDAVINVTELVQMWIAEGFVRSKQETHLMDMAIGRTYVNLLLDRRFFHNAINEENQYYSGWNSSDEQRIRVDGDIREMAMYIGEKKRNCLLKAGQGIQNFPTVHNADCERISLRGKKIENLPSEFRCPKLVSLILSGNRISVVPSGFLVGLTSLKVLDLSYNSNISSIPSSVGQLQQLQLLRLENLDSLKDLPEEIGHLSSLQFLTLIYCSSLQSLPSQIGQLQNLKYLNIGRCKRLRVIPHEISQLTALTTLDAKGVELSVEAESERSICGLKGLINLTMLRIKVEGYTSSGIGGIMGTWLDMRHLWLEFDQGDYVMDDLPDDMQNMRKLQSLRMDWYRGLSLPEYSCRFQHLQYLELNRCPHLKELSPLERLPSLRYLELFDCSNLKELGISGKASGGFLMLEELVLSRLEKLESMAGPSNHGEWNERTLPKLSVLGIEECPNLKRLPVGMDKLLNLKTIKAPSFWRRRIIWENDTTRLHFENIFENIFEDV